MLGRRAILQEYGETPLDAIEHHLRVESQPFPDTESLAPTDLVIEVRACAVGWVDLLMMSGQYQHMVKPPYTPGLEYSGVVAWVGHGVTRVAVGDRVLADGLYTGPRSKGPYQRWGGFARYAVAPERAALPLPEGWSFDQGCCLLGNYETAYHCLIARGRLQADDTVLIHGASGSTGLAAVHLAKLVGATVIATGRNLEKLHLVKAQGADHILQVDGQAPGFRDQVKELTDGLGVSVVYDGVGGPISLESMRSVRFGARYLIVGWAATPFVARGKGRRGAPRANQLPTNRIMMKGLDVLGCPTAITTHRDPSIREERLGRIRQWIAEGRLEPYVQAAFPFDELRQALQAKWESRYVGGCVVRPG